MDKELVVTGNAHRSESYSYFTFYSTQLWQAIYQTINYSHFFYECRDCYILTEKLELLQAECENLFCNIDSSGQLSPSGQDRKMHYDSFLNREKDTAANFQNISPAISHISIPVPPATATLSQRWHPGSNELLTGAFFSHESEQMALGREGGKEGLCKWQGLQSKLLPDSRGPDLSGARQKLQLFMHNRFFSFEMQSELIRVVLYKKSFVNLFPQNYSSAGKMHPLIKAWELQAAVVTVNTLQQDMTFPLLASCLHQGRLSLSDHSALAFLLQLLTFYLGTEIRLQQENKGSRGTTFLHLQLLILPQQCTNK